MKTFKTTNGAATVTTAAPNPNPNPNLNKHPHKMQGAEPTHTRYKNPYDNLLYCILLQAVSDKFNNTFELTKTERRTAKQFFTDGTAKTFYEYLKGAQRK